MLALPNLNSKLDIFSFRSLLSNKDGISAHLPISPSPHLPIPLSPHDFATRTLSPSLRYPAPSTTIFFPGCKPVLISIFPPLRISPVSTF